MVYFTLLVLQDFCLYFFLKGGNNQPQVCLFFFTDPPFLHFLRCHDDHPRLFLPDHLPEIIHGCCETPLGGNVDLLVAGLRQGVLRDRQRRRVGTLTADWIKSSELCLLVTSIWTYFHKVGVDVIRAHNIRISRFQDDPGVVDWCCRKSWWERDRKQF